MRWKAGKGSAARPDWNPSSPAFWFIKHGRLSNMRGVDREEKNHVIWGIYQGSLGEWQCRSLWSYSKAVPLKLEKCTTLTKQLWAHYLALWKWQSDFHMPSDHVFITVHRKFSHIRITVRWLDRFKSFIHLGLSMLKKEKAEEKSMSRKSITVCLSLAYTFVSPSAHTWDWFPYDQLTYRGDKPRLF